MARRQRRRDAALARKGRASRDSYGPRTRHCGGLVAAGCRAIRVERADHRALLLGTALATTLLIGVLSAPSAAYAQATCDLGEPGVSNPPGPIDIAPPPAVGSITCDNDFDRRINGGAVINLNTDNPDEFIVLDNSGHLTAVNGAPAAGIRTDTTGTGSFITITNAGEILATTEPAGEIAYGIGASTLAFEADISITNSGRIEVATEGGAGANASGIATFAMEGDIHVTNSGELKVTSKGDGDFGYGIFTQRTKTTIWNAGTITARTEGTNATAVGIESFTNYAGDAIDIVNSGDVTAVSEQQLAYGVRARVNAANSAITIENSGHLKVAGVDNAAGINATSSPAATNSPTNITNTGRMDITANGPVHGIFAFSQGAGSGVMVDNRGDLTMTTAASGGRGIFAFSSGSPVSVYNTGGISITGATNVTGISAAPGLNSGAVIDNRGEIYARSTGTGFARAISVLAAQDNATIAIDNRGDLRARAETNFAQGISGVTIRPDTQITIRNHGVVHVRSAEMFAHGIAARALGLDSALSVHNSGDVRAETQSSVDGAFGIYAMAGPNTTMEINNAGSLFASGGATNAGILAVGFFNNPTTISNTGEIGASSHRAIDVNGAGPAHIYNAGLITGFVDLTNGDSRFFNQSEGVFEAKQTSLFRDGEDLFVNEAGGTVQAATDVSMSETTRFTGLETFRNRGLISMVDGRAGDRFTISNTVGGTDLDFQGGGTLGVDVFLDGPASPADLFKIEGNVSGVTTVAINNTNVGPGTYNSTGITVVEVTGATPDASAFQLAQPVDTGFFDYDLVFRPRGSGDWELRSFTGAGAFLLPQLVTAAQDIWHQGSSTWFDRTADLRVLLAGGMAPTAYDPSGSKSLEAAGPYPLTPAVWARGSGSWLDRDDSARTSAYGRNYSFNLDRELTTLDFQVGVDLGQRDVWSDGDALVFGVLGGFVYGGLDYDAIPRSFDFSGGQVGAYATYMNGGLFVDTLLNVHLYELSTATLGFPSSLDANTVGLRTDAGYRFGSFTGGAFLEPLATIEATWADIDGFSLGGNRVSFDDDANVRGRLGLRAGTTMEAWHGTLMEPFVIGSVWGNLSDDNSATLVSTGRTFRFQDNLDDVWGEISGGLNFFNVSQTTAVFAKVDVTDRRRHLRRRGQSRHARQLVTRSREQRQLLQARGLGQAVHQVEVL